jgi:hypothetical protein
VGLTGTCGGSEEGSEAPRPYQVAVSGGVLATPLSFGGPSNQRLDQVSTAATLSDQIGELSLQLSAGAVLAGSFDGYLGNYQLQPGPLVAVSAGWTFVDGEGPRVYLAGALSLSFATMTTQNEQDPNDRPQLTAFDVRLSGVIGKRLFGFWLPYGGVAVFGGPVLFDQQSQTQTGSNPYHVRFTLGSAFDLSTRFHAFVEIGFFGEEYASAGLGYSF